VTKLSAAAESTPISFVRGACPHDCPDTCAWTVTVDNGRAVELRGDPDHPFTRGGLCAKVNRFLEDRTYNPDRLLHPLRRTGPKGSGEFEPVGWDEALADIAARWQAVIAEHGPAALLPFSYMGNQGAIQTMGMPGRLFGALGASELLGTICGGTSDAALGAAMGSTLTFDPEEIRHARYIVLWGTNTVVTNLHLWPFIDEARRAGAAVVCIDPLRTRTAAAADWHLRPRPGTDQALALGLANVILADGLADADYLASYTTGLEVLRERAAEWSPERVESVTGIAAADVKKLAHDYASTRPSVIRLLVGMEHHSGGGATYQAVAALPSLTGAWRERGGGLLHFTMGMLWRDGVVDWGALLRPDLSTAPRRPINMVQLGRALTDQSLDPRVHALLVFSANPAVTIPNSALVREGLSRPDLFTVVHEQFLTDTARYADYVLPSTTTPEHLEVAPSWGTFYLTLNQPAITPQGESVSIAELCRRLARALGLTEPALFETDEQLARAWVGERWDEMCEHGWVKLALPSPAPYAEGGFLTPTGRHDLTVPAYVPARESLAGDPDLVRRFPLQLLTAKGSLHFINSSYAHVRRSLNAEKEPLLDIAAEDAASRGIADGDLVRVANDRGAVSLRARVGDRVPAGVVSMPSGWAGDRSANLLTADGLSDMGGGADFHSTLVEVSLVDAPSAPAPRGPDAVSTAYS
jgi:anaerobic selenocysteine-containing dehydrogenase